jgi:hypothetical protein
MPGFNRSIGFAPHSMARGYSAKAPILTGKKRQKSRFGRLFAAI